jgi:hypothetical protein
MGLTVAVTRPTGEIGISAVDALEREPAVTRIVGMARREWCAISYTSGLTVSSHNRRHRRQPRARHVRHVPSSAVRLRFSSQLRNDPVVRGL